MGIQAYILKCNIDFDMIFPDDSIKEVLSYTNGTPYIKITICEGVYLKLDSTIKLFFNNPNVKQSGLGRISTQEDIESICDSLNIETNFHNEDNKK